MTDKELKKLSRLELLELLLESGKENKKLKEKINSLKEENKTSRDIENLSVITGQIESVLKYANSIADKIKANSDENSDVHTTLKKSSGENINKPVTKADRATDSDLYKRMLSFFAKNDDKLDVFPADLEYDIRERIRGILERKNKN